MKKSVLLGIAAVALLALALPASAANVKYDYIDGKSPWVTYYIAQTVKDFPVKLKIPWFIRIVNEKDWEIELVQVDCANSDDFPCFEKCKNLEIRVNFNARMECAILDDASRKMAGNWSCRYEDTPGHVNADIDANDGVSTNRNVCVLVKKADLLSPGVQGKAGEKMTVATLRILVAPR